MLLVRQVSSCDMCDAHGYDLRGCGPPWYRIDHSDPFDIETWRCEHAVGAVQAAARIQQTPDAST